MFMGQDTPAQELDEFELWKAQQIAQLVELQQSTEFSNDKEALLESIAKVIEQTCSGKYAGLAKHLGIAKSTICGWLQEKRVPSADTSLRIARFAQVDWATLLMGIPDALELPELTPQLSLPFDFTARPKWTRQPQPHDWSHVEQQLQAILKQPMPVSVTHAASVVRIPARMLYMYCNTTARKIGQRWLEHLQRRQLSHVVTAWPHLEKACRWLLDNGIAPNMREVEKLVPAEILSPISNTWDAIREVRQYIESSEHATAGICDNAYPRKLVMD